MKPIAVFYHCLFFKQGTPPSKLPAAEGIVQKQMCQFNASGLMRDCEEFHVGVNGSVESERIAQSLFPRKSTVTYNGLDVFNENATIRLLEQWLPKHPDWLVLWCHSKGATHDSDNPLRSNWRECMMRNLVTNWRTCVHDLENGCEAVGCHWMSGDKTPPGQSIFAGNFWWATSNYLRTLPSIMERDRIKVSGLGALESRYEAEVWLCNGPKLPKVRDYHPAWIDTCTA